MDMTPMIDVVFQLLIFFMCTIKFKTLEGKLSAYLPKDVGVNSSIVSELPKEKVDVLLKVVTEGSKLNPMKNEPWSGEGPFRYAEDRVIEYRVGPRSTRDVGDLRTRLRGLHEADKDRAMTIDAYPGTVYADIVKVLDAAIEAGFSDITFKGDRSAQTAKKKNP